MISNISLVKMLLDIVALHDEILCALLTQTILLSGDL